MKQLLNYLLLMFFISSGSVLAQNNVLTGTITDIADGEPMIGVTVVVKGTTVGTVTNFEGTYNLKVPADAEAIVYSFIGYKAEEVAYAGQQVIDIVLQDDSETIDEIVVTGYGIQKKGTYTGSAEVVSAEALEQVPVASFDQALQGRAAGVVSVGSSGRPGAGSTVRIRGMSSINAGSEPLYIMDGVPITSGQFSSLNQNDIENVTILKDATATSLYGSRASNGVIVITTKKGQAGMMKVQYRGQYGYNQIARDNYNMMNTEERIWYEEAIGLKSYTPQEKMVLMRTDTNWLDEVLKNAMTQSHEISFSGGNDRTVFYVSGSYYYQDGIQYRSDFERYNTRINLETKVSDRVIFGTNLTIGYEQNNLTVSPDSDAGAATNVYNPIFASRLLLPYLEPRNADGSYNSTNYPFANPIEQVMLNENSTNTVKIVGSAYMQAELAPKLVFKTNLGFDFYDYTAHSYLHPDSEWGQPYGGLTSRAFRRNFRFTPTNTLNYNFSIDERHNFNLLGGQELVINNFENFGVAARSLPSDKVGNLGSAAEIDSWAGGFEDYTFASFFTNVNYNYNYKYLVDFSVRQDGSSRFGANNRWGTFWSAGAGWNMQEEEFIKDIHWIDQLKLRGSIGTTGNANIGNYEHLALWGYDTYMNNSGAIFYQYANEDLTWEKKLKTNVAIDLAFLRRYRAKVELYSETTKDMLYFVPTSLTSGISGRMENIGEMNNSGIEFEFEADVIRTKDFGFTVNANVAYNRNRVTKLYGDINEIDNVSTIIEVDRSFGTFYLAEWAGVNTTNGKGMWYTADGEVTEEYSDAHRVVHEGKSFLAPWSGGFTTSFSYKNLELSAFFTWMADKWMINNTRYFTDSNGMFATYNQSADMLDFWQKPGDVSANPHPKYQDNQMDTRLLEDASFMRLKNLTLSYRFNPELVGKTNLFTGCRVYAQGQNLLTFTKYSGFDPEFFGASEANMYPHVRTFTFGIDLSF
ncbi:SusC/RagA family TonB-linked outer membrane protein [Carboxylicivirga linearis]|uniref:TonB-dependent receptor n=1 Tax=Carboxylicivirga linearis TaxID=1628157 RepID=A0ABS5JZQ8_9BACT|nr:TonB-dependent receptor [Carboxylicivirga linearis]MBS2100383.1 TonB-dependent receptor [Carboxylicivirga linearis]